MAKIKEEFFIALKTELHARAIRNGLQGDVSSLSQLSIGHCDLKNKK